MRRGGEPDHVAATAAPPRRRRRRLREHLRQQGVLALNDDASSARRPAASEVAMCVAASSVTSFWRLKAALAGLHSKWQEAEPGDGSSRLSRSRGRRPWTAHRGGCTYRVGARGARASARDGRLARALSDDGQGVLRWPQGDPGLDQHDPVPQPHQGPRRAPARAPPPAARVARARARDATSLFSLFALRARRSSRPRRVRSRAR